MQEKKGTVLGKWIWSRQWTTVVIDFLRYVRTEARQIDLFLGAILHVYKHLVSLSSTLPYRQDALARLKLSDI